MYICAIKRLYNSFYIWKFIEYYRRRPSFREFTGNIAIVPAIYKPFLRKCKSKGLKASSVSDFSLIKLKELISATPPPPIHESKAPFLDYLFPGCFSYRTRDRIFRFYSIFKLILKLKAHFLNIYAVKKFHIIWNNFK